MNKKSLKNLCMVGFSSLLISGCASPEWKRACNAVNIDVTHICYIDAQNWVDEARSKGYSCQVVNYFPGNKFIGHSIVEFKQSDGTIRYIEPQNNWKTIIRDEENANVVYNESGGAIKPSDFEHLIKDPIKTKIKGNYDKEAKCWGFD